MKFSVILLIALIMVSCSALKAKKLSSTQQSRIAEIKKGSSWAGILMNLAELHMMAKGPVDELVQAIQDTVNDLQYKREKRDAEYETRTNQHIAEVSRLETEIANAQNDIESLLDVLDMLAEQKAALEEENSRLTQDNADSRVAMADATRVREKAHDEYEVKILETNEALEAVEECLQVLNDFQNPSFAQVKKVTALLQSAQKKISKVHSLEGSFLNALVQVAVEQQFADSQAINNVIAKFNEIKNNFYSAQGRFTQDEQNDQAQFEQFISDQTVSIYNNNETITYNNDLLVKNAANTEENKNLLAQRRQDKSDFEDELAAEHQSYDDYVARYTAWCTENDREVAVCAEALEVVATLDFADYIGDRINKEDGLVSSGMRNAEQHGQGTEVFNFDYQF